MTFLNRLRIKAKLMVVLGLTAVSRAVAVLLAASVLHQKMTILEVNEISSSIAAAVEEQTAATQEITRNVHEAAGGTQDVSKNISGVSTAVDKAGQAAGEVLADADELAQQSDALRREVDGFLATVRAA